MHKAFFTPIFVQRKFLKSFLGCKHSGESFDPVTLHSVLAGIELSQFETHVKLQFFGESLPIDWKETTISQIKDLERSFGDKSAKMNLRYQTYGIIG